MVAKYGEKHQNEGFVPFFRGLREQILIHFVPFPRDGIAGADYLVMSYFIVVLLFR